jgi:hypothetical protein
VGGITRGQYPGGGSLGVNIPGSLGVNIRGGGTRGQYQGGSLGVNNPGGSLGVNIGINRSYTFVFFQSFKKYLTN